jgi:excisionase family DNA binding protein
MSSPAGCSLEEAAERLSVSVEQVRDLIAAGTLKTTGSGEDLRVTPDSLLVYMMSRISADLDRINAPRPGILSVAADILLPVTITLWFMAACAEVFSLRDGKPIVSLPVATAVLLAMLGIAWGLAWRADGISSVNGVGTALYGRRMTPEGRVGTQWMTFASVPLLPIRSYVILEASEPKSNWVGTIQTTKYRLRPLGRMYWPQILPVVAGVWAGLAGLVALALLSP